MANSKSTAAKPAAAKRTASPKKSVRSSRASGTKSSKQNVDPGPSDVAGETVAPPLKYVHFGCSLPKAHAVFVAGSFNNWSTRETPMKRDSLHNWSVEIALPPGEHSYRFVVDGEWRDDPQAQAVVPNRYGGFDCVVVV